MCGIIGYVGKKKNAIHVLINGLKALEYRGYDSAGIAYMENNKINIIKEQGKIKNLEEKIDFKIKSNLGIGHTRWATHGKPCVINSHPHKVGKITIVHNGIIENYEELKKILIQNGYSFKSETDTEVICALIDKLYNEKNDMIQVLDKCRNLLKGSYALGIINDDQPNTLYAIRKDSPLIIAIGENENYISSDVPAILDYTNKYILLDNNEIAKLTDSKIDIYNINNEIITKKIKTFEWNIEKTLKNGYDHFMLKEINEQPEVIKDTLLPYISNGYKSLLNNMPCFKNYEKIDIVACGSAYHAGLIGKYLIEKYADIPVNVEIASEYRYKKLFINNKTLVIIISQSGETADSLAALRKAKEHNIDTLAIVNVVGSSIAREAKDVLYIKAGCEIAVATTKAYSAQVAMLGLIALNIAKSKKKISNQKIDNFIQDIDTLINEMKKLLKNENYLKIAKNIYNKNNLFFIGRKIDYALAMEGSLKLKEISYIHSEAYPAGELKHGSISLIEEKTPVFAIVTDKSIAEKTISNIKEAKARGAEVILIITDELDREADFYDEKIVIPKINDLFQPLLSIIPLQLISYEVAKLRNCDIDKPRNLAKSVTVE
ncbi:MAG: glutamine--fructose-6-phosphate transaminase (isomerizing) [Mollicutes bacterium]|nr:glutamine--fructose-6-phosphate transaminase (isomerizing) [Mollicutes bacterium]